MIGRERVIKAIEFDIGTPKFKAGKRLIEDFFPLVM